MGKDLFIEDLGSTNGTAVNGVLIGDPYNLRDRDVVSIGDVDIVVRYA